MTETLQYPTNELGRINHDSPATIEVKTADLVAAWSVLERTVVSLATIGRCFGQPVKEPWNERNYQEMLLALDQFLSPELLKELSRSRRALGDYIPDDEAEDLSEKVINYWEWEKYAEVGPQSEDQRREEWDRTREACLDELAKVE